jgi:hypothetical protein
LTKTRISFHRFTLKDSTTNKNVELACEQNLQKAELGVAQALKSFGSTCLGHICIML